MNIKYIFLTVNINHGYYKEVEIFLIQSNIAELKEEKYGDKNDRNKSYDCLNNKYQGFILFSNR